MDFRVLNNDVWIGRILLAYVERALLQALLIMDGKNQLGVNQDRLMNTLL